MKYIILDSVGYNSEIFKKVNNPPILFKLIINSNIDDVLYSSFGNLFISLYDNINNYSYNEKELNTIFI